MKPRVFILRTAGTNCDGETAHAFQLAGAETDFVHINRLLENPKQMDDYQILALPGGFSYGDDISAGRILANQLTHHLRDVLHKFVAAGKPVIGICNGFQVLVKTEFLPGPLAGHAGQTATLTNNTSGRFIDRWIQVAPPPLPATQNKCIWTTGLEPIDLPIAHGEGKFICASENIRKALWENGQVALVYSNNSNPNGSTDDIAGVCDSTGLIFGLMPHPERYVEPFQHPAGTSQSLLPKFGKGLRFFQNAVRHIT